MKYFYLGFLIILGTGYITFYLPAEPVSTSQPVDSKPKESLLESDRIVGRVNDEIITQAELDRITEALKTNNTNFVLKTLIKERLLYQMALKEEIEVSDDEVTQALKKQMNQYDSPEAFETAMLKPLRISLAQYQIDIKRQMVREKFILSKMGTSVLDKSAKIDFYIDAFIAPKEIKTYYEAHLSDFIEPEQIKTKQIILRVKDGSELISKKALAEALLAELQKGADFDTLARRYSEIKPETAGAWDWVPKKSFPKNVEDVIYQLKIGEISPVIQTETDFRIVKLEDKKGGVSHNVDSPEIQEKIRRFLMNKKVTEGAEKLVQKLAQNAHLWPVDILVPEAVTKKK